MLCFGLEVTVGGGGGGGVYRKQRSTTGLSTAPLLIVSDLCTGQWSGCKSALQLSIGLRLVWGAPLDSGFVPEQPSSKKKKKKDVGSQRHTKCLLATARVASRRYETRKIYDIVQSVGETKKKKKKRRHRKLPKLDSVLEYNKMIE